MVSAPIQSADGVLAKIDRATAFLAEAKSLQEVNAVIAMAEAAGIYAKRVKASQETINQAAEIHLRAERKLGELLKANPKNPGSRGQLRSAGPGRGNKTGGTKTEPPVSSVPKLSEVGIDKKLSGRAQQLAAVPEPEFEESLTKARNGEINHAHIRKGLTRKVRQDRKQAERIAAAEEAENIIADDDVGVRHGDFRQIGVSIADNSVDLIFTDPPYDRKTLPLYGDMAELASRILKPGGSLICYMGQYQIGEVINLISPHLRLWWTLAVIHTGQHARMTEYGVIVKWKPLLWFVKRTRGDKQTMVDDLIASAQEKSHHDWQQSEIEASYYIDKLTMPGGLVFDPFCGGGTTPVAAKKLKRRWLTCDVDEVAVKIARKRVHDAAV